MHQFYNRCAYFTAARYMRTIDKVANKVFEPTKLSPTYSYIMFFLEDYGESSITDIALGLGYDRTTVSRMIYKLERSHFVIINSVGRKSIVTVTGEGEEFLLIANRCLNELKMLTDQILGETKKEMTDLLSLNNQKIEESEFYD